MSVLLRLLRRAVSAGLTLWLVLTLTFLLLRAVPGGPFDAERELPPQELQAIQKHYGTGTAGGLGRQYLHYLRRVLRGDLGPSYRHAGWSVNELLRAKAGTSFELGSYALLLAALFGISWGCRAAMAGDWKNSPHSAAMTVFLCIPTFVLGPILGSLFSQRLHWFSAMGWCDWRAKVLPVLSLAFCPAACLAHITRQSMGEQWNRPYVRTARAKGLTRRQIFRRHIFRNGISPAIAYLGPTCATLLSGTFVVEGVFHIPGLGSLFIESIINRDYTVISAVVLLYAALISLCNFLSDALLACINPHIRSQPR
jgi:oligopeptide transport system permease protein